MKPGAGARKGGAFERLIARRLSLWLTRGEDGTQLVRSQLSGGWRRGLAAEEGWRQVGDLAPNGVTGELFRRAWAVECKHRRTIEVLPPWPKGGLVTWWRKLELDAAGHGMEALLVFRANRRAVMVAMSRAAAVRLPAGAPTVTLRLHGELEAVITPLAVLLASDPGAFVGAP